jgi:hypothetical protein
VVPQRSLVIVTLALGLLCSPAGPSRAQQKPADGGKPPTKEAPKKAPTAPARPPIEERPYKIRAFISFDPLTRIDARARDRLLREWRDLSRRMIGMAWDIQVAESEGPATALVLEDVKAAAVKPFGEGVDKVWLIQGTIDEKGLELFGRELDVTTGYLGSLHSRKVPYGPDLVRDLFRLSLQIFAPFAEIGEAKGDVVPLKVQGSSLPPGLMGDALAAPGSIFRPIRVFYNTDDTVLDIQKILFSYLRVVGREGTITECSLIRGVRDPLTKRIPRKNRLIALGIKAAAMPTKVRFIQVPDRAPAAGYVLTYKPVPQGNFREVATTDREGRVSIPPRFADGLVILRLIAGKSEPVVDLPLMPGETEEEVTVPIDPKPLTITLETQLDALRDAVVDQVAVRSRLERRMKAREQGDDWAGVEESLVEFRKLPPKDGFVKRLETIQAEAQKHETGTKLVVMTRTARAQFAETKSLIDRYLDDELFRAYEDAVVRAKERDERAKIVQAKPKPPPPPGSAAVAPPPPRSNQAAARPEAPPAKKPASKPAAGGIVPF